MLLLLPWGYFEDYWPVVGKGGLLSNIFFAGGQWPYDSTEGEKLRVGCVLGHTLSLNSLLEARQETWA